MKVKIDTESSGIEKVETLAIELPQGEGTPYLWFGTDRAFVGVIESKRDLKRLRKMIDSVLKELP